MAHFFEGFQITAFLLTLTLMNLNVGTKTCCNDTFSNVKKPELVQSK